MLVIIADPFVDERVAIKIRSFLEQVASVCTDQIKNLYEFFSASFTVASNNPASLAFFDNQLHDKIKVSEKGR